MRRLSKNILDAIKNCIKDDMQSIVDSDQSLSDTLEIVDACVDNHLNLVDILFKLKYQFIILKQMVTIQYL